MDRLRQQLRRIDGRSYPAYKGIKGAYSFDGFVLEIVHVQGDPFAAPSKLAVRIPLSELELELPPPSLRIGMEDGILRGFAMALRQGGGSRGSGKSGQWGMVRLGQEMLARTACHLSAEELVLRFTVGLPAAGRRILGREAEKLLIGALPEIVRKGVFEGDREKWWEHGRGAEDQDALRALLFDRGWVGFVANGALLPRYSGADDRPMGTGAVGWESPPELEQEVELPHQGKVRGTAIPKGITLICGGGYHGKSTLLEALSRGVYNHVPGDGRELCVSLYDTVAVRAEDGRSVAEVNISGFINNLPNGKDTEHFDTENASGSTSQAANIIEALEMGSRCLLIDEDTSAANFMVRDRRMQELVSTDKEPITPFVDRVRDLFEKHGVSTVIVVGGAGDYFDVADQVLQMDCYRPQLATARARALTQEFPGQRLQEKRPDLALSYNRAPVAESFDPSQGRRAEKVRSNSTRTLQFGRDEVDVSLVEQLVDEGQTRTIGDWMVLLSRGAADGQRPLREICEELEQEVLRDGLFATTPGDAGDRVFARRFELAAAVNRLRTVEMKRVR